MHQQPAGFNAIGVTANLLAVPALLSKELANTFTRTLAMMAIIDCLYNLLDLMETWRRLVGPMNNIHIILFSSLRYDMQ